MDEIKKLPVWLLWKKVKKGANFTKVPYKKDGTYAATDNPETWETFPTLEPLIDSGKFSGIGIVFEKSAGIIGIDLDHCVTDGEIDDDFLQLIKKAKTYTEYSPSKTGIHLLFRTTEIINLVRNKYTFDKSTRKAVEAYSWGRFFTFTEDETRGSKPIRTVTEAELTEILQTVGYPWIVEEAEESNVPEENKIIFTDKELLTRMFASKNGDKIKRLYEGDLTDSDNDPSAADYSLCCHLAFWSQKDFAQIDRIWKASPLGQREKTQKRKDYRTATVNNAIKQTQEVYTQNVITIDAPKYDFLLVEKGPKNEKEMVPAMVFANITRVLRYHPLLKGKFRLNDFSHMTETCFQEDEWVALNDSTISKVREMISEQFPNFIGIGKELATDAIMHAASGNKINPPKDYITTLTWDKEPRLNSWLHNAYGTPDDELHQSIGSNWFKGLVKRVIIPGCQFDEVLALESPQGWRKSTSIRELGQPWHVETTHSIESKDFYLLIAQNIIVEFSEGEIFDRASVNKLKAEITKTEDQVRPPYERGILKFKRSCVFAVTTNKLELKDDTGNRRWLPVQLQKPADIDWIIENRDQLYAEAYYRAIITGETSHEYPTARLEELQKSRTEYSEEEEGIVRYIARQDEEMVEKFGISLKELVASQHPDTDKGALYDKTFASHLRKLHMENRAVRIRGVLTKRWFPTDKTLVVLAQAREGVEGTLEEYI